MDTWSMNFLSNKVKLTKGNKQTGKIDSTNWGDLDFKELKTFDTFIKPWTWQISPDIML